MLREGIENNSLVNIQSEKLLCREEPADTLLHAILLDVDYTPPFNIDT